jgi:uncharacterized surface protein with fasciclin (FAS1) repeats
MSNITQVINVDKNLKSLKRSIHASDVDQVLSSSGPYTFFAPSEQAFDKLGKGVLEDLLEPQNRAKLAGLLKNHIVSGKIVLNELKDGDRLETVNGKELMVEVKNGVVSIDNTKVQPSDTKKITNGVMHVMDSLIMK